MLRTLRRILIAGSMLIGLSHGIAASGDDLVDGQVRKIDVAAGKITLKHGPIKNLDMDSMTMVFRVKDPAMLKQVKVGDKVQFEAEEASSGYTVTKMQKSK